jgi:hypothetical protein
MGQKIEMQTNIDQVPIGRRRFIGWLLSFSVVSTLGGVLTPIVGYFWPPARASSGKSGRTLVGTVDDFPLNSGKVVSVNDEPVIVVTPRSAASKLSRPSVPTWPASCIGTKHGR